MMKAKMGEGKHKANERKKAIFLAAAGREERVILVWCGGGCRARPTMSSSLDGWRR